MHARCPARLLLRDLLSEDFGYLVFSGTNDAAGNDAVKGAHIFLSGKILSLIIFVLFNVAIVRLMTSREYAIYAVLFAMASIANTVGSLGFQRFIPKFATMARSPDRAQVVARVVGVFLACRIGIVAILSMVIFQLSGLLLNDGVQIAGRLAIAFILMSTIAGIYTDAEIASQSLNQQIISRYVAVGEPLARTLLVLCLHYTTRDVTGERLIWILILTQGTAFLVLAGNGARTLWTHMRSVPQDLGHARRQDLIGTILSGYLSGIAALGSSPPMIRFAAATFMAARDFGALSFVQTVTLSLQRYSPGFILYPFIEPAVMSFQKTEDGAHDQRAGALLSIVSKVDAVGITLGVLFLGPFAGDFLSFLAGDNVNGIPVILLLGMTAIMGSTLVRACEVGANFVGAYRAAYLASICSGVIFVAMITHGRELGLLGLVAIPTIDSFLRAAILERAAMRSGLRGLIDWRVIGPALALNLAVAFGCGLYLPTLDLNLGIRLAIGVVLSLAGVGVFALIRPLSHFEGAVVLQRVHNPKLRRVVEFMARTQSRHGAVS